MNPGRISISDRGTATVTWKRNPPQVEDQGGEHQTKEESRRDEHNQQSSREALN